MKQTGKILKELDRVVIKFAGDSGDGIQFTGAQFSATSGSEGIDISTLPDFPAEIRAPQGTIAGVSGFQVHIGSHDIQTPGDKADVLVAMNPAALKANLKWLKTRATIIIDIDNFDENSYKKAGYVDDPFEDSNLDEEYDVIKAPITNLTRSSIADLGMEPKSADKIRNQFAAGIVYFLFNKNLASAEKFIEDKFKNKPIIVEANKRVLRAGYDFAETLEAITTTYRVDSSKNKKGIYRNLTGNTATAWGLVAAAEKCGKTLFLGSYPITPATEILQELAALKSLGVKTFQAEDEIAGVCSAIGASFAGCLGITTTSGPGLCLKAEGIGLAVMTELPLVVVNVQRGGPSTGLPTKPEQSDLMQALYGRNGESPVIVLAGLSPAQCFEAAFLAAKLAVEHMTPVILLTDGYLANGSEVWKIKKVAELPAIKPPIVADNDPDYKPYQRDAQKLARSWAIPGQKGLRHYVGGLEKSPPSGTISYEPWNHQRMTDIREEKVKRVENFIEKQQIIGETEGDLLVVGWGGTYGALLSAVNGLRKEGKKISLAQFMHIKPLPKNTNDVFKGFKKILVCELNNGQFANYLRSQCPDYRFDQYNKVQGLPFMIAELKKKFNTVLEKVI